MAIRLRTLAPLLAVLALLIPLLGAPPAAAKPGWRPSQNLGASPQAPASAQNARGDSAVAMLTGDGLFVRARKAGGFWSAPAKVFDETNVNGFDISVDGTGRATVVAMRWPASGAAAYARTQTATGWSAVKQLSDAGSSQYGNIYVVQNERGATAVSFSNGDGTPIRQVVYRRAGSSTWSAPKVLDGDGAPAALDIDRSGRVVAAWIGAGAGGGTAVVRTRSRTADGFWSVITPLSSGAGHATYPSVDVNASGVASVVFGWTAEGSPAHSVINRIRPTATASFGPAVTLDSTGGAGTGVGGVATAVNDSGDVTTAWTFYGATHSASAKQLQSGHGEWSTEQPLASGALALYHPAVAYLKDGSAAMFYVRAGEGGGSPSIFSRVLPTDGALSSPVEALKGHLTHPPASTSLASDALLVALTPDGVRARALDASGPVARMTAPVAAYTKSKTVPAAWSAVDAWSGIGGYVVQRRRAAVSGGFGGYGTWLTTASKKSGSFSGVPGSTYCMRVRAKDKIAHTGPASAERCTAVPIDDRGLAASAGWSNVGSKGNYLNTVRTTSAKGRTLSVKVRAKRLALLASRCPSCGVVEVYLGNTKLKRISLAGKAKKRVLVPVRTFGVVRSGMVRIVVVSAGKRVLIDGLATSQR